MLLNKLWQKKKQKIGYKPSGFWYSCHNDWYDWIIRGEMDDFLHKYIHEIKIYRNVKQNINY